MNAQAGAFTPAATSEVLSRAPHVIGAVSLVVRNGDAVARFYEDVVGLKRLDKSDGVIRLGTETATLLTLVEDRDADARSARDAGLFHTAFLLPTRADLGAWVGAASAQRFPVQGASDHGVSEAIYLADPEGNGIEIYADKPASTWPRDAGSFAMVTEPMDVQGVYESAGGATWQGFPEGGFVGHVHLQVGTLTPAENFYSKLLGFDLTQRYPGANFYGSGGYHHQLASNIWNSRNAAPRPARATGLSEVLILVRDTALITETAARLEAAGVTFARTGDALTVADPWGTPIRLKAL